MKIKKLLIVLLILFIISFNIIVSDCEHLKNTKYINFLSKHKRSKLSRSHSKLKPIEFILKKLKEITKETVIEFIFGIVAEFSEEAEALYNLIKPIIDKFMPCFNQFGQFQENDDNDSTLQKSESVQMLEKMLPQKEDKREYCKKTKDEIYENFKKATFETEASQTGFMGFINKLTPDFILDKSYDIAARVVNDHEFCIRPISKLAPKIKAELKKKYSEEWEYYKECKYFAGLNCDIFDPEVNDVWPFVKKSLSFLDLVQNTGTCIVKLFDENNEDIELVKVKEVRNLFKLGEGLFYKALNLTLGVIANVFTFGLWGGIKGGYYLIQLAVDIKEFYEKFADDKGFKLGKLIGKGIVIAKSFILGRKRLMKRRK